jgi:hypothetical protein
LDEYAAEQLKPSARAAVLALEVDRLERMEATFLKEAIANHDIQAGTLVVKISTRKSMLLGLDQPVSVRMDVTSAVEPSSETRAILTTKNGRRSTKCCANEMRQHGAR